MNKLTAVFLAVLSCLLFAATAIAEAERQPDIILFIADDLTYWDLGAYGGQARTPHIDSLASEGMKFERAYQNVAVCSPTRQNLLTGLYPVRNGAYPHPSGSHRFAYLVCRGPWGRVGRPASGAWVSKRSTPVAAR